MFHFVVYWFQLSPQGKVQYKYFYSWHEVDQENDKYRNSAILKKAFKDTKYKFFQTLKSQSPKCNFFLIISVGQ